LFNFINVNTDFIDYIYVSQHSNLDAGGRKIGL